ncbi:MAG TPA: 4-hydroxy-tetrahydrodipicolinate synthase [Candidatus Bathyarchaeota archaeon]|nr:4-hydroxy-tetrahydrodipicolinate synthase [Candidatus Bathyarchaeota archaeon]
MSKISLEGIFVPHITPFDKNGEVDLNALRELVDFWIEEELAGLVPCGSNGEAPHLLREERRKVIETVVDAANGRVPVIAGTGAISTKETIQLTRDAEDIGVDAALIVTPFYFKYSMKELYAHYSSVIEAVNIPIILYNVPKFTGFSMEPELVHKLTIEYSNIIGIKDSSGSLSQISELIRLVGDKIAVLAGTADVVLPTLMLGGKGAIIAVANVEPRLCSQLYKTFKDGKLDEAAKLQRKISYLNEILVRRYNQLSAIKEALKLKGLPAGYPRKPALPLESSDREKIKELLGNFM